MEAIMGSRCPGLVVGTLGLIAVSLLAGPAQSEEFQCRRGDLVRRIELRFADDTDRLPCQVVYWKDQESPGQPWVPWKADHDLEFCIGKAREMADDLQSAGWTCDNAAPPAQDAAELNAIDPSAESPREPAAIESPDGSPHKSAATEAPEGSPGGSATTEAPEGSPGALAAIEPPERSFPEPAAEPPVPPPPDDAANGTARSDQTTLQAALDRDIRRLEELGGASSGRFKPEMTTLGDLNSDGVPDGAVLLSHRDDDGGSSHHLLAYLFDGHTFRPVARLNLESYYQNVTSVALGPIADGGIELLLHTRRAGDQACCPSGRRNATFELRDGQFVLVAESDSGA
jgi:hypothetical protein